MKKLALFDFDGTITRADSFIEFIKFSRGLPVYLTGFARLSPILALYKAGLLPNWKAKEKVMRHFWAGMTLMDFNKKGEEFATAVLPSLCRPKALERIGKYQAEGWRVVVVSASASNWIKKWADQLQVELISTELVVTANHITGKIDGKNCYGPEKVNRIMEKMNLSDFSEIHAYGDSSGDREMLAIAHESFYKPFRD